MDTSTECFAPRVGEVCDDNIFHHKRCFQSMLILYVITCRHGVDDVPDVYLHLQILDIQQQGDWWIQLETKVIRRFVITEKAPTRSFSWLKAATTAFTFKLRHFA